MHHVYIGINDTYIYVVFQIVFLFLILSDFIQNFL